jgi:hypothetical protein
VERINGVRIIGHGGDAPGISAQFDMHHDLSYKLIALSNYDQSMA